MQRAGPPVLSISTAPSIGTYSHPIRRAASAGISCVQIGRGGEEGARQVVRYRCRWPHHLDHKLSGGRVYLLAAVAGGYSSSAHAPAQPPRSGWSVCSIPLLLTAQNKKSVGFCHALFVLRGLFGLLVSYPFSSAWQHAGGYRVIPPVIAVAVLIAHGRGYTSEAALVAFSLVRVLIALFRAVRHTGSQEMLPYCSIRARLNEYCYNFFVSNSRISLSE